MPPPKKVPQTEAIFTQLNTVHQEAAQDEETLRVSLDAKATIPVGPFSRGGYSRTGTQGVDHDFKADSRLTPFGIFLPDYDDLSLSFTTSKVTSDFIVDRLTDWWQQTREQFPQVRTLVLDLDNGPENNGCRSQFLHRLVEFASATGVKIRLCYYPPYHSKYNPIERCWGILENYWRGELLDSEAAVLGYARNMTYNGHHPQVQLVTKQYPKGVKLTKAEKRRLETRLQRLPGLEKWSIDILPVKTDEVIV